MILELLDEHKWIFLPPSQLSAMDALNSRQVTTSPSSFDTDDMRQGMDEVAVLYQILQELQRLKLLVSAMMNRRRTGNPVHHNRSTQTECYAIAQHSIDNAEPLDLAIFPCKRPNRERSSTDPTKPPKSSRLGFSAGGSIEQAVAKIKERIGSAGEPPSVSTSPDSSDSLGQVHRACPSPSGNSAAAPMNMVAAAAAAAAAVAGHHYSPLNGGGDRVGAGLFPFSPLFDSLMLSTHCDMAMAAAEPFSAPSVHGGDLQQKQQSSVHFALNKPATCQKAVVSRLGEPPSCDAFVPPECKAVPDNLGAILSFDQPGNAFAMLGSPAKSSAAVAAGTGGASTAGADGKAQKSSSFGADYYKPYACQHANCNKRFANKFLLKKHEFIHTGERPHQCPYCCKRFNRKDNLLRHKKTHESSGVLVKRASARPLELICQTDEVPMGSVALDSSGFGKLMHHQFSASAAAMSPEGCFDQDQSTYDEEDDEDEQIEETIKVKQDNSSTERNECHETMIMAATGGAAVSDSASLTPSNVLLAAVTPKTTSTSQLPIATSFGVTN